MWITIGRVWEKGFEENIWEKKSLEKNIWEILL
jgi:hypothetical protein